MKDRLKSLSPVAGSAVNTALECCKLLCLVLKNVNGFVNRLLIDRKAVCTLIYTCSPRCYIPIILVVKTSDWKESFLKHLSQQSGDDTIV
jgi:hypothetical protein